MPPRRLNLISVASSSEIGGIVTLNVVHVRLLISKMLFNLFLLTAVVYIMVFTSFLYVLFIPIWHVLVVVVGDVLLEPFEHTGTAYFGCFQLSGCGNRDPLVRHDCAKRPKAR